MSSSRSEFLRGLSARLESDRALREREREEAEGVGHVSLPEASAGEQDGDAPGPHARQLETEHEEPKAVAPAQRQHPLRDGLRPRGVAASGEGDQGPYPATRWSEAGMPLRLRDAIASVRRVSYELDQTPRDEYALPAPPSDDVGYDEFLADDDAAADSPMRDPEPALDEHAAYEYEPRQMGLDDNEAFRVSETRFGADATREEQSPRFQLVLEDEREDEREELQVDDGAAAYQELSPGDEALSESMGLDDDGGDEEPAPGVWEAPQDRLAARHGPTRRYGVHLAAFAVAVAFVALAGFGLGLLSGRGESGAPQVRDTLTATPAPSSTGPGAPPAESQSPAQLGELVTVRVAPAPGATLAEPEPAARASASVLPLPPPPKPDLRQSATDQTPPVDGKPAGTADDAARAAAEAEGTGGPFQPLFAKLPRSAATPDEVLVHYTANAAGAPATAMHLVRQLKAAGFRVEARPVQFPIAANTVRYFFASDRGQAEALRAGLESQMPHGAELRLMDFTSYAPKPQQGHLEVWLRP